MIGAISYGELASMMPHVGGQYVYLKEAYHPLIGFFFGWTTFLVIQCGTIAAVAVAFAKFQRRSFSMDLRKEYPFLPDPLKIKSTMVVAIGLISFLTWLNTQGIVTGKTVQNLFLINKGDCPFWIYRHRVSCHKDISTSLQINKEVFWQASKIGPGGQS